MPRRNIKILSAVIGLTLGVAAQVAPAATPATWTTTIDPNVYNGTTGTITFNDWGYKGPTGVGANDFQVGTGFDATRIGQVQHVITKAPDRLTPDASQTIYGDLLGTPTFSNANMDGQVNFFVWGYTTPANSTFSNMQIDKAGNYHVAKTDMAFGFYNTFSYHDDTGVNPDKNFNSRIKFQPYAISDAKGWCGSVLTSNPNGVATMAGQVTFDFAFDAYVSTSTTPTTQIVPGFVMRSYGSYEVNTFATDGTPMHYTGSAVGNNTNPLTGQLDPAYQNKVSFLGGGVVPAGVWVSADSFNADGSEKMRQSCNPTTGVCTQVWDIKVVAEGTPGAVWHTNSFGGYAFLLRADANRTLEWISPDGHSDYVTTDAAAYASIGQPVPVPAAVWLFGSGLLGLGGLARYKKKA